MALADPGTNNFFYDLVPASVGSAADAVVKLALSDGPASTAVDGTADKVPVAESGVRTGVGGNTTGAAGEVGRVGHCETAVEGRRTDGNNVLEEAGLIDEEMETEALFDDLIGPAGASSTDTR